MPIFYLTTKKVGALDTRTTISMPSNAVKNESLLISAAQGGTSKTGENLDPFGNENNTQSQRMSIESLRLADISWKLEGGKEA